MWSAVVAMALGCVLLVPEGARPADSPAWRCVTGVIRTPSREQPSEYCFSPDHRQIWSRTCQEPGGGGCRALQQLGEAAAKGPIAITQYWSAPGPQICRSIGGRLESVDVETDGRWTRILRCHFPDDGSFLDDDLLFVKARDSARLEWKYECLEGRLRYLLAGRHIYEPRAFCTDPDRGELWSPNCHGVGARCQVLERLNAEIQKAPITITLSRGTPGAQICLRIGGLPQIVEFEVGGRWHLLDRCYFASDGSFLDQGSLFGRTADIQRRGR